LPASRHYWFSALALLYVVTVLIVDTGAALAWPGPFDWTIFRWRIGAFDLFKFIFWFLVPVILSVKNFDWGYYGVRNWQRKDVLAFLVLVALGSGAVWLIPRVPVLRSYYLTDPKGGSWTVLASVAIWNLSWLPGWEFLHRYFLLRRFNTISTKLAVGVVALCEAGYHLQKPWPEMVGMFLLSIVLSTWATRRKNGLLPLLVHVYIEVALALFLAGI
jgi:hypothetical protein